jgi:hypothetical protein
MPDFISNGNVTVLFDQVSSEVRLLRGGPEGIIVVRAKLVGARALAAGVVLDQQEYTSVCLPLRLGKQREEVNLILALTKCPGSDLAGNLKSTEARVTLTCLSPLHPDDSPLIIMLKASPRTAIVSLDQFTTVDSKRGDPVPIRCTDSWMAFGPMPVRSDATATEFGFVMRAPYDSAKDAKRDTEIKNVEDSDDPTLLLCGVLKASGLVTVLLVATGVALLSATMLDAQ